MTLLDILQNKPTLYGSIMVKGSQKIGSFKPIYSKYTNTIQYVYYTEKGNIGQGGDLLQANINEWLAENTKDGKCVILNILQSECDGNTTISIFYNEYVKE